jgi:hypothetical protein
LIARIRAGKHEFNGVNCRSSFLRPRRSGLVLPQVSEVVHRVSTLLYVLHGSFEKIKIPRVTFTLQIQLLSPKSFDNITDLMPNAHDSRRRRNAKQLLFRELEEKRKKKGSYLGRTTTFPLPRWNFSLFQLFFVGVSYRSASGVPSS